MLRVRDMQTFKSITLSLLSVLVGTAGVAMAEDLSTRRAAPVMSSGLELAVSGGYTQGVGDVGTGMAPVEDFANAGGGGELQVGYRINPNIAVSAYAGIAGYSADSDLRSSTDIFAPTTGIKADWHFLPAASVDPWVSLGTGVRWLNIDESSSTNDRTLFGLDIVRLEVGAEYRVSSTFAIGPVASVTATTFLQEDNKMTDGYEDITDSDVNFNFAAGLMGRFGSFAN